MKKTKAVKIREYLNKNPQARNKDIVLKFNTVASYVHKVRKEIEAEEKKLPFKFPVNEQAVTDKHQANTRLSVLSKAEKLVSKDRAKVYGDSKINHERIAKLWSVILGEEINSQQVIMCMTALKLARLIETPDHTDTWTDICGYGALGGEDD